MLSFLHFLGIAHWADITEIVLFSTLIYAFSSWLRQDQSITLLVYFYSACGLFICASLFHLQALVELYRVSWPAMLMLFIIVHQKSLQHNYIAAKTVTPTRHTIDHAWVHVLMRALFKALQRSKNLTFVIEGKRMVEGYITKPVILQSPITHGLLDTLIESTALEQHSLVLLNQTGSVIALNGTWMEPDISWFSHEQCALETWQRDALFWTSKTDALVIHADIESKLICIVAQGTIVTQLTSDKAEAIITQYIRKNSWITPKPSSQKTVTLYR